VSKARTTIPKSIRFEVFKRDYFKCKYCGASAPEVLLQVDHIEAVSKGGTDDMRKIFADITLFPKNSFNWDALKRPIIQG